LAAAGTQPFQEHDVLARLIDLPGFHVEFAQIFERALVLGVEVEGFSVERIGLLVVAGLAQAKTHQVVNVGVLMGLEHRGELRDRSFVSLALILARTEARSGASREVTLSTASAPVAATEAPTSNAANQTAGVFMLISISIAA